jgi:hypothetical protein
MQKGGKMLKVNDIEKVLAVLPGGNRTRFEKISFEEGVRQALLLVLGMEAGREIEVYAKLAKLERAN